MLTCQLCGNDIPNYKREVEQRAEIASLQAELVERDKTILEQQARIDELHYWLQEMQKCAAEDGKGLLGTDFALLGKDNLSALEAALKAERIKTLEDAETYFTSSLFIGAEVARELRRMANELKESQNHEIQTSNSTSLNLHTAL